MKIVIENDDSEETKDNPENPVYVERDREKRDTAWENVRDLTKAASKAYIDGKTPMSESIFNMMGVLKDKYREALEIENNSSEHRDIIKEDLESRREEEREKNEVY